MSKIPLSRNIRFVEALAFLSLVFRGLAGITAGESALQPEVLAVLGATLVLMLLGLVLSAVRRVSWVVILVCGLVSVAVQPFEADGLLWILAAAFAMFHDGWFAQRPRVVSLVAASAVVAAQVLALVLHPENLVALGAGILLADAALGFLIHTFRHDLLGTGAEHRPLLRLADYGLTDREVKVLHLLWGGQAAKEISFELGLSDSTIRKDLSSIYQKLGVIGAKELYVLSHSHRIVLGEQEEA